MTDAFRISCTEAHNKSQSSPSKGSEPAVTTNTPRLRSYTATALKRIYTARFNQLVKLLSSSSSAHSWESVFVARRAHSSAWKMLAGCKTDGSWSSLLLSLSWKWPEKPLRVWKQLSQIIVQRHLFCSFCDFKLTEWSHGVQCSNWYGPDSEWQLSSSPPDDKPATRPQEAAPPAEASPERSPLSKPMIDVVVELPSPHPLGTVAPNGQRLGLKTKFDALI